MKLRIDVWSDVACPWCYVGKRRLERALAQFPHEVELVFHSFELDPSAPRVRDASTPYVERLARKYRQPIAGAQQMIDRMTRVAADEGIDIHFDRVQAGNTFDAHRLLHLALEHGVQAALNERLMRAYFCDGIAVGEPDALVPLAVEVGLAEDVVREVLGGDRYSDAVRGDEQLASELGITGVPFFVLGGRLAVSGAQTPDVLLGALERSRAVLATEAATAEA